MDNYLNRDQEWAPKGQPVEVEFDDFIDAEVGKVFPYGVYAPYDNPGWEHLHRSIRRLREEMGEWLYLGVRESIIMGGGGGRNCSWLPS